MKRGVFVIYPVHAVLLNFTAEFRHHLLNSIHTLVGLFSVGYKIVLNDIESAGQSENCDTHLVRTAQEII